eukprot:g1558.t1
MGRSKHKGHHGKKKPQHKQSKKQSKKQNKPTTPTNATPSTSQITSLTVENEGEHGVIKLTNLANTCYFNSVLQMLMSSTHFEEYLATTIMDQTGTRSNAPLSSALLEIFSLCKLQSSKKTKFKPTRALGAIRSVYPAFKGKAQHDAHELLMVLLQLLVEEEEEDDDEYTITTHPDGKITDTLFGQLTSLIRCLKCGYTKSENEVFMVISTSIVKDEEESEPLTCHAIELPDVVEREVPQTHDMKSDESPLLNNLIEDTRPQGVSIDHQKASDEDDSFPFVPEWFDIKDEFETGLISESERTEKANNDTTWQQQSKGKKKKKKGNIQYQQFETWDEFEEEIEAKLQLNNLEECLDRFFSSERVTWRCPKEFPEKRVTFSESEFEVLTLPSLNRQTSLSLSNELSLVSSDEEESSETVQEDKETKELTAGSSGLKSCLKKTPKSPKIATPLLNSTKQYVICKAPKVLCIHLKRFESGRRRRGVGKLSHSVHFDLELDISRFSTLNKESSQLMPNYELRAVVCHSGSMSFGHYTCFVSRIKDDQRQWYDVSDSEIRTVSASNVLKSQAYILLYEAVLDERNSQDSPTESGSNHD